MYRGAFSPFFTSWECGEKQVIAAASYPFLWKTVVLPWILASAILRKHPMCPKKLTEWRELHFFQVVFFFHDSDLLLNREVDVKALCPEEQ